MKRIQHSSVSYVNKQKMFGRTFFYIALSIISLCYVNGYSISKFSEDEKFGQDCPELDTCRHQRYAENNLHIKRNCACDEACSKYNDCCIDAPTIDPGKSNEECYDIIGLGGVYMIGSCPQEYDNEEHWRELCEASEIADPSDPLGTMPVTDIETGLTYKNIHCKWCNEHLNVAQYWIPKVECPLLPLFNESGTLTNDYVIQNLNNFKGVWGINVEQEDGENFFLDCSISPVIPKELQHKIRRCNHQLIEDCPSTWKDQNTRQKCNSYLAPRFTEDATAYRNVHCAVCNNVNESDLSCHSPLSESLDIFRFTGTHSFALLMDVNFGKGERVGMIKLCQTASVYDPFFRKCRRLECIPGFIRKGRKCFPHKPVIRIIRKPVFLQRIFSSTGKPSTEAAAVYSNAMFASTRINANFSSQKTTVSHEIRPSTANSIIRFFEATKSETTGSPQLTAVPELSTEALSYEHFVK